MRQPRFPRPPHLLGLHPRPAQPSFLGKFHAARIQCGATKWRAASRLRRGIPASRGGAEHRAAHLRRLGKAAGVRRWLWACRESRGGIPGTDGAYIEGCLGSWGPREEKERKSHQGGRTHRTLLSEAECSSQTWAGTRSRGVWRRRFPRSAEASRKTHSPGRRGMELTARVFRRDWVSGKEMRFLAPGVVGQRPGGRIRGPGPGQASTPATRRRPRQERWRARAELVVQKANPARCYRLRVLGRVSSFLRVTYF